MSALLLTMGPQLGIIADTPAVAVGGAGTITFKAVGSFGQVRWSIVGGDLPVEWGAIVPAGDEATVSTAEAIQWGDFEVTVRAVDDQRAPVVRTFSLRVATAVMEIDAIAPQEWIVGTPVSLSRAISGGTGVYSGPDIASGNLPAGVGAAVVGSALQISGTPTAIDIGDARLVVSDSHGSQAASDLAWEVTSPPKIIIGGGFTTVGGVTRNRLARLNHDGTLDMSFSPSFNTSVSRIRVLPSGKILVVGGFTQVNGVSKPFIVMLNADGSVDAGFNCAPAGPVYDVVPLPSGKFFICGNFGSVNGSAGTYYYARINADGSTDTSFGPCSANNQVISACVLPSGKMLVSGYFTTIGGQSRNALALLNTNGTVDTSFNALIGGHDGGYCSELVVQPDGKVLLAGGITSAFGVARYRFVRLNADLTLDTTFAPRLNFNLSATASVLPTGVLVGGSFSQLWNGTAFVNRGRIGVVDAVTGAATAFNPNANNTVNVALPLPNGTIFIAGGFTQVSSTARTRMALVSSSGTLLSGFDLAVNAEPTCGALQFL